jgi:hypothetical protein
MVKGWHARPGKETVDERAAANSRLDHPPERGVPCCAHTEQPSIGTEPGNVATTPTKAVDPNPWPIPIVTGQSALVAIAGDSVAHVSWGLNRR